jgi:hypothetical protein
MIETDIEDIKTSMICIHKYKRMNLLKMNCNGNNSCIVF